MDVKENGNDERGRIAALGEIEMDERGKTTAFRKGTRIQGRSKVKGNNGDEFVKS